MPFEQWIFAFLLVIGASGLAVCYFGALITLLTALGNKRWVWSAGILVFGPLVGIPYVFSQEEADYPKSLMIKGLLLVAPAALAIWALNLFSPN